jgi:Fur family ferric uptake transcriptional regulator
VPALAPVNRDSGGLHLCANLKTMRRVESVNSSNKTSDKNNIEALCIAKGMRMTEQRRTIARVLAQSDDHPDVEELYNRCIKVDDRISISTVYRTMRLFEEAGIIERHDFREGRARYETSPEAHHDHLINLRNGEVIEFQSEEIERLQAEVARKLGYRLIDHRLELYAVPLIENKK